MQISYRHDRINAGWFVVEELQSTIENEYETAMGNGCMSVFGVRLGHHRRDGEAGSERQSLCLILLVYRVRGEEVMGT
jgi:hypothetical protein